MSPWAPFEWITAIRFLKEGRMQSMFIIAGVAIGVAVIVFMSALLSGLQQNFLKRVLTSSPHIQMIPADEVVLLPTENIAVEMLSAVFAAQLLVRLLPAIQSSVSRLEVTVVESNGQGGAHAIDLPSPSAL